VDNGLFDAVGQTDIPTDGQTDMTMLTVIFPNFATAPIQANIHVFGSFF